MKKRNYKHDKRAFAARMEELMKMKGFSTEKQFAKYLSIAPSNLSKWKKDVSPRLDVLIDICNKCDCDLDYLVGRSDTLRAENNDIQMETGLSEEAIEKLRAHQDAKRHPKHYLSENRLKDLVPDFISFILTYEDSSLLYNENVLENVLEDIYRRKMISAVYFGLNETIAEVCMYAYIETLDTLGYLDRDYYTTAVTNRFEASQEEFKALYKQGASTEQVLETLVSSFDIIKEYMEKDAANYLLTKKLICLLDEFYKGVSIYFKRQH